MNVITGILKVIGFLVLFVLGILLLHVILLLFIPFRYRVHGSTEGKKLSGDASVRWLFGYLNFQAAVDEAGLIRGQLKVLGFQIWSFVKQLPIPGIKAESTDLQPVETSQKEEPYIKGEEQTDSEQTARENIREQIREKTDACKETVNAERAKLTEKIEKLRTYRGFFLSDEHKATFSWLLQKLLIVLQELKPTDGRGEICFGFEDPYSTAQVLEVFAFLYPFYGAFIKVVPFFDKAYLSACLDLSGRIRLWKLGIVAAQVYFSKDVKALTTEFRRVSENG